MPPVAVRLRRDFGKVLNLIRAHALLHQATRERDGQGRIVASLNDYAAVRDLVADLVAKGVEATVPATIRETVAAVRALCSTDDGATLVKEKTTSVTAAARLLKLDKGTGSRRVRVALDLGYLKNEETGRGKPYKLALGEPLPAEVEVLPTVAVLQCWGRGDASPPPIRSNISV